MESVKQQARQLVEKLPDDVTWDQFLYRVYMYANVMQGLEEIRAGKGIPNDQVMKEMDEWLKSLGRPEAVASSK